MSDDRQRANCFSNLVASRAANCTSMHGHLKERQLQLMGMLTTPLHCDAGPQRSSFLDSEGTITHANKIRAGDDDGAGDDGHVMSKSQADQL